MKHTNSNTLRSLGPLIALIVIFLGFAIAEPRFATLQNLVTIANSSAVLMVLAVGMTFVVITGAIDLSVEGVMGATALAVALLVLNSKNDLDLSILGVVAAIGIGCLIGLVTGILTTRLLIPSFMVTLGVWSASSGIAKLLSGGKPPIIEDAGVRDFALGHYMFGVPNLVLVAAAVVVLGLIAQNYTRFGRYSYMIGGAEDLVRQSGISVDRYKIAVFALSGLLAGLAGVMETARVGVGESVVGTGQMFSAITAVVIGGTPLAGGRGGVAHSVVGVLIIKVLESGMVFVGFPPYIQQSVQGFFVLVAVVATTWHLRARLRVVK